jgi:hypothetical protein
VYRILIDLIPALKVPDKAQEISNILLQGRTFIAIKKAFKSTGFGGKPLNIGTRWDRHKVIQFIVPDISH